MQIKPQHLQTAWDNRRLIEKAIPKGLPTIERELAWDAAFDSLCRSARLFRPELGFTFSTLAMRGVFDAVRRALKRNRRLPIADDSDGSPRGMQPDASVENLDAAQRYLARLEPRERYVVVMKISGYTLGEIGARLRLTKERVRQIYHGAISRLEKFASTRNIL